MLRFPLSTKEPPAALEARRHRGKAKTRKPRTRESTKDTKAHEEQIKTLYTLFVPLRGQKVFSRFSLALAFPLCLRASSAAGGLSCLFQEGFEKGRQVARGEGGARSEADKGSKRAGMRQGRPEDATAIYIAV